MASKKALKNEADIVKKAQKQFRLCQQRYQYARRNYIDDYKYGLGDSINRYQWDGVDKDGPMLTVNKCYQHCRQIINDNLQNKQGIKVSPVTGADFGAAQILEACIRRIEYQSNAQDAYNAAVYTQVIAGQGYWRINLRYLHDGTFDQDIFIERIEDPLSVYTDPNTTNADGSDMKYAFIYSDMTKDEFESEYPDENIDDYGSSDNPLGVPTDTLDDASVLNEYWIDEDKIRVCEYFRIIYEEDTLHELDNGMVIKKSEVENAPEDFLSSNNLEDSDSLLDSLDKTTTRTRTLTTAKVEWYKIAGSKILKKTKWPGKYIPIVRIIGEEFTIDGRLDIRGHVRAIRDSQDMYNFGWSQATQQLALQTKTPYVASAESISGYEKMWENANLEDKSVLIYKGMTSNGVKLDPPTRIPPPEISPAYLQIMQSAEQGMMMASGQYEANLGQKSNEVSGKAVIERQRQGDNATYHFIDRFGQGLRYSGRIIVDLIRNVYDTPRVMNIIQENGSKMSVKVDPNAAQPVTGQQDPDSDSFDPQQVASIFNPTLGEYEVETDVGPSYGTQRQEQLDMITTLVQNDPNLMPIIGEFIFAAADFPDADKMAERMHNMTPPQALGKQPPNPQVQQMQQQMQQLQALLAKQHDTVQQLSGENVQLKNRQLKDVNESKTDRDRLEIDRYKAETERLAVVAKADPEALRPVVRQLVSEALGVQIMPVMQQHAIADKIRDNITNAPHPHDVAMDKANLGLQAQNQAHSQALANAQQASQVQTNQVSQDQAQQNIDNSQQGPTNG
jgi:hypothetical protein